MCWRKSTSWSGVDAVLFHRHGKGIVSSKGHWTLERALFLGKGIVFLEKALFLGKGIVSSKGHGPLERGCLTINAK